MKLSENIKIIIKTSRPLGWIITPAIFVSGLFSSGASLNSLSVLQALLLSFPFSLFLFGVNDVYDYETDKLNPRKGSIEGSILDKKYHKSILISAFIMAIFILFSSILTKNLENLLSISALLFISYFYSSPPIRAKSIPFLDSIFNGLGFLFAFFAGYSFGRSLVEVPFKIYLAALGVCGIHSLSTIMDYEYDKKSDIKTVAVLLGKRLTALFSFVLISITYIFGNYKTPGINHLLLVSILSSLILFVRPSEKLARIIFKIIYLTFIYAFVWYLFY